MGLRNFVIELAGPYTCRLRTIVKIKSNERTSEELKETCIKEQIYFELLYESCI